MKKVCIFFSISILILLSSCQLRMDKSIPPTTQTFSYHITQIDTDRQEMASVNELESSCTDIVQGVLLNDAKTKIKSSNNRIDFGITVSSLKINKVYKGSSKVGSIIKLGERYFFDTKNNEKTLYSYGNYLPSNVGQEYLFFLCKQNNQDAFWSGIYLPNGVEQGRYPVLSSKQNSMKVTLMTNRELSLGNDSSEHYKELFAEVKTKYMNE